MIKFTDATYAFKGGAGVSNASFSVSKGDFICILGPTGAGKTTLLKMIYMDAIPQEGTVEVAGYNSDRIKSKQVALLRRKVGMVFQDFELLGDRSVFENVALPLHVVGMSREEVHAKVDRVLNELGLATKSHLFPYQISGGEQQIVSLARAIVKDPLVVLADEPTGNLDPVASFQILKLLEKINEAGTAVLMATHNYNLVKDRDYRFIEIVQGQVRVSDG
ncbi:MAG: cell division ATP-binding protein FtsE [Fidelibacterota bacterium]